MIRALCDPHAEPGVERGRTSEVTPAAHGVSRALIMNASIEWVRRARIVGALAGIIGLAACEILGVGVYAVELRIQNTGSLTFDKVTLPTPDGPKSFFDLKSGERTAYFGFSGPAQSNLTVDAGGETLFVWAIHGEGARLEPGKYTYLLQISEGGGGLFLYRELRDDAAPGLWWGRPR